MNIENFQNLSTFLNNELWSFTKVKAKPEPFHEFIFKECRLSHLEAKIEFLEKNLTLIKSECEAIEFYLVKEYPEFAKTDEIDLSWMPYNLQNINKPKLPPKLRNVVKKAKKHKNRQSMMSVHRTKSMFSLVRQAMAVHNIEINSLYFLLERTIINMKMDFDKIENTTKNNLKKIKNYWDNKESDCQKKQLHIKEYRSKILEAGFDTLTKRIPASKYQRFVKQQLEIGAANINRMHVKIAYLIEDRKLFEKKLTEPANTLSKIDLEQFLLDYSKLDREVNEKSTMEYEMRDRIFNIEQNDLIKYHQVEKKKKKLNENIISLGMKIKAIRRKIKIPIQGNLTTINDGSYESDASEETYKARKTIYQLKTVNSLDVKEPCPLVNPLTGVKFRWPGTTFTKEYKCTEQQSMMKLDKKQKTNSLDFI